MEFFTGLCWKILKGVKRTTKQNVAIFLFDKNQLKFIKEDREAILDVLRRGVIQLTKIRHPRILTVEHPLEESRDSLAFVTEPILASLANYLGNYSNMPSPNEPTQFPALHDIEISERAQMKQNNSKATFHVNSLFFDEIYRIRFDAIDGRSSISACRHENDPQKYLPRIDCN